MVAFVFMTICHVNIEIARNMNRQDRKWKVSIILHDITSLQKSFIALNQIYCIRLEMYLWEVFWWSLFRNQMGPSIRFDSFLFSAVHIDRQRYEHGKINCKRDVQCTMPSSSFVQCTVAKHSIYRCTINSHLSSQSFDCAIIKHFKYARKNRISCPPPPFHHTFYTEIVEVLGSKWGSYQ